jgi:hypothetical protein
MVDAVLVPAIKGAIKANEIGNASPYVLSYAKLGTSGASFGDCQGDTNSNSTARATLLKALQANDTDTGAATRIMTAVSRPCPNGNPLSPDDTSTANEALSCDGGRALVDAMDDTLMNVVMAGLDTCITAANTVGQTIDSQALLYIALWVNMTGPPTTLKDWLSGTRQENLGPPAGAVVTVRGIQTYLKATKYFSNYPSHFAHIQQSVNAAVPLLPSA